MKKTHLIYLMAFLSPAVLAHSFKFNGLVMDVENESIRNGTNIILYPPHGGDNQNFIFENGNIKLALNNKFCLDNNHMGITLWECNGGDNQKFTINNGFIHPGDKPEECVTVKSDNKLKSEKCTFSSRQKFDIPKVFTYKDGDYRNMTECTSDDIPQLKNNDTMSSVSIVNGTAIIYEHNNFSGKRINTSQNINFLGSFNDVASSLRTSTTKTFLMTSDPQLICTKNCDIKNDSDSIKNVRSQYEMFNSQFLNADAVFINGDLTEFGHGKEWDEFEWQVKKLSIPYYYGLGNHDIFNNYNDCYKNNCGIRSITKLYNHVKGKNNIASFDAWRTDGYIGASLRESYDGSLSYSMDFGEVLVIQLNDYTGKANPLILDDYLAEFAKHFYIYRFQDSDYTWLERQLYSAYLKNQIVIVNQHRFDADAGQLISLLEKYNVKLRFAGHLHSWTGGDGEKWNRFYLSGSTAKKTYLKTEIDATKSIAKIYLGKNNTPTPELIQTVDLKRPANMPNPKPPLSEPIFVQVRNTGGYEAFASIVYKDKNGARVEKKSGKLLLGNYWRFIAPAGSTVEYLEARNNTGLVWEPQRRIFMNNNVKKDHCVKVYGTTLHPQSKLESCR